MSQEEKFKAKQTAVVWAITWNGAGTIFLEYGKTAGEAYENLKFHKPPFGQCRFLEAG